MQHWYSLILLLWYVGYSLEYCYIGKPTAGTTECILKDGTHLPIGDTMKLQDQCERCTCHGGPVGAPLTLSCCGYGIHAGVIVPPPGCKIVADDDGCSPKLVRVDDQSKLC